MKLNLWSFVFGLAFAFQLFRAQFADSIIFGVATFILILSSSTKLKQINLPRFRIEKMPLWLGSISLGIVFAYIPRHRFSLAFLLVALGLILLTLLWNVHTPRRKVSSLERKSETFWAITAIAISLWELSALVISRVIGDDNKYPTISELVVPLLNSPITRMQFVAIWICLGWLIIRHWKHS
ncbi:MAG: hypothetical protein RL381_174 [Actinomycetota bacterium]|jgi:hypothetical protein